jgi:hypothetical protein
VDAARARVLARHTAEHRATELEGYVAEISAQARKSDPMLETAPSLAEMPR